jgi:hypothetical protein
MRLEGLGKLKKKTSMTTSGERERICLQPENWTEILDESSSNDGVVSREELCSPWS